MILENQKSTKDVECELTDSVHGGEVKPEMQQIGNFGKAKAR